MKQVGEGEFYTHEEVLKAAENRLNGKQKNYESKKFDLILVSVKK